MSVLSTKRNMHLRATLHGFTLIEMMVSLTIFSIVMLMSTSTLLILIDANAKGQALYSATTNLSFALDSMTRELRTGYHYYCYTTVGTESVTEAFPTSGSTRNCSGENTVAFIRERDGKRMGYRFIGSSIEQKVDSSDWAKIISTDVSIDTFLMVVNNSITTDAKQPTIDLRIVGHVNNGLDTDTDFNIQTRIVERRFDIN